MRRYLYLLLVACLSLSACEPETSSKEPVVVFHFGAVEVETTQRSATITADEPYITVDGKRVEAKVWLQFIDGDLANPIEEYEKRDGKIIFAVDSLTPENSYNANLVVESDEYGKKLSDTIIVITQKYIPEISMTCDMEVEAKGLMATVNLTNVAYLVYGASTEIHAIKVEYKRTSAEEWTAGELQGSAIKDMKLSVALPLDGEDYLEENRNYHLRVTLFPASGDHEPLTSDVFEFKTEYAEVTANIAAPALLLQGNYISASVENVEVFYDGIPAEEYKEGTPVKYYFYYRVKGAEKWSIIEAMATNGDISATLQAEEGNTYEFMAVIVAGAMQKARESAKAEIDVPKSDVPTPPTPPTGGGDTSSIAGVWHLTAWRGAVPSFDIYLDITADGVVTLWQRLESRAWECFYSSADIEDGVIFGTYTDGAAWGASYSVTLDENTMTWVATNDSTDISVYTRAELPEDLNVAVTRAAESQTRFL